MPTSSGRWVVIVRNRLGENTVKYSDTNTPPNVANDHFITLVELLPPKTIVFYPHMTTETRILTDHGTFVHIDDCVRVDADYGIIGYDPIQHFTSNGVHIFVWGGKIVGLKFTEAVRELSPPDETWFGNIMMNHLKDDSVFDDYIYLKRSELLGNVEKEMKLM